MAAPSLFSSLTARDLRWAGAVAVLLALSPLSGAARLWLSVLLGAVGGVALLGLLAWYRRGEGPPADPPRVLGLPGPGVAAALLALAAAFAPTLVWLFSEYTISVWRNAHGFFVPVFVFLLARAALRRDPEPAREESSPWGFAFVLAGLALALLDAGVRSHHLAAIGLLLCVPGLSLLLLGTRRTRRIAPALALCVFALPSPVHINDALWTTQGTAVLAEPLVKLLGIPALRHETFFATRLGIVGISQNCSGLSTLHAALALCAVFAISARSWRRGLLPLLVAYPLTLGFNALRLVGIVAMHHIQGPAFLHTPLHGFSGLIVIWAVFGILWLCCDHRGLREALW